MFIILIQYKCTMSKYNSIERNNKQYREAIMTTIQKYQRQSAFVPVGSYTQKAAGHKVRMRMNVHLHDHHQITS